MLWFTAAFLKVITKQVKKNTEVKSLELSRLYTFQTPHLQRYYPGRCDTVHHDVKPLSIKRAVLKITQTKASNENTPMGLTFLQPAREEISTYLLAFLLASLGESLCDDRDRELSLWERSERSDFGDGDFARLLPLLREGLGEPLCRLFLRQESKHSYTTVQRHTEKGKCVSKKKDFFL